jgi:plastocyanin
MFSTHTKPVGRALAALGAVVLISCGGGEGGGGPDPEGPVLTTLEVTPTSAAVFNTAPGNSVNLLVVALDQDGQPMTNLTPAFTSGSTGIATVSTAGTVTAVAAGTAQITISAQQGGVTLTKVVPVTVQGPPLAASIGSSPTPQPSFVPPTVHLSAGGDVTWSLTGPEHSVTFVSSGSPASVPSLINAAASRTCPNAGTYNFVCDFHPTMSGTVYVH